LVGSGKTVAVAGNRTTALLMEYQELEHGSHKAVFDHMKLIAHGQ